jgi:hypothetical protein
MLYYINILSPPKFLLRRSYVFSILKLDVSKWRNRAFIRKLALREGIWSTIPYGMRQLFNLTLHPSIKKWWGRIRWPTALDILKRIVKMLALAWNLLKSRYFRRCYAVTHALIERSLAVFDAVRDRVNPTFRKAYLTHLGEALLNPETILYTGTMAMNDPAWSRIKEQLNLELE